MSQPTQRKYPVKAVALIVTVLLLVLVIIERQNSSDVADYERCIDRTIAAGADLGACR